MSVLSSVLLALAASPVAAVTDPVVLCRDAHGNDAIRHIACLEQALRSAASSTETATDTEPTGLGAEQVRAGRASGAAVERVQVRIVSTTYDVRELGTFRMADGQVWEETEKTPRHQRLAGDREYDAYIEPGKLGGYRMYVDGVRRMIKLRRIE